MYLDADKLCYATRALRFAYNSMVAQVAIFLSTGKYENLDT